MNIKIPDVIKKIKPPVMVLSGTVALFLIMRFALLPVVAPVVLPLLIDYSPINLNPGDRVSGILNCPNGVASRINPFDYSLECLSLPATVVPPSNTPPASVKATRTPTLPPNAAATRTPTPVNTASIPTQTERAQGDTVGPFIGAPLCETHDNSVFHTLWNSAEGCHYDHEHGQSPFTPEVETAFPGFDLFALLGNVQVGHTNPSSDMENTHKHGGNKWNVQLVHPQGCAGFESAATGVNGSVIQFHGFGDYAIEAEVRIHSSVALLRQCKSSNPNDFGYIFVNQLQDYGQRITPYQGTILPYPNQPIPAFPSPRGPYLSFDCDDRVGASVAQCASTSAVSNWASKVTGTGHSDAPALFRLLWRVIDNYQTFDWNDQVYPFKFFWLCTSDGGVTYNPVGCRKNNATTQVHEIAGVIPASWDNLAGWDSNPAVGRITAQGFVDGSGNIAPDCTVAGGNCYPIKLVNAFTGTYGSVLVFTGAGKGTNVVPHHPSRNIYFCNGVVCSETSPGAVPSGWIGSEN